MVPFNSLAALEAETYHGELFIFHHFLPFSFVHFNNVAEERRVVLVDIDVRIVNDHGTCSVFEEEVMERRLELYRYVRNNLHSIVIASLLLMKAS